MSTLLDDRVDEQTTQEPGIMAHIVWPKEKVTEAYILGIPVLALCGHLFTPSRDPKKYPVCQKCVEVWKEMGRKEGSWST